MTDLAPSVVQLVHESPQQSLQLLMQPTCRRNFGWSGTRPANLASDILAAAH